MLKYGILNFIQQKNNNSDYNQKNQKIKELCDEINSILTN